MSLLPSNSLLHDVHKYSSGWWFERHYLKKLFEQIIKNSLWTHRNRTVRHRTLLIHSLTCPKPSPPQFYISNSWHLWRHYLSYAFLVTTYVSSGCVYDSPKSSPSNRRVKLYPRFNQYSPLQCKCCNRFHPIKVYKKEKWHPLRNWESEMFSFREEEWN
jgi:hypothetical protein